MYAHLEHIKHNIILKFDNLYAIRKYSFTMFRYIVYGCKFYKLVTTEIDKNRKQRETLLRSISIITILIHFQL